MAKRGVRHFVSTDETIDHVLITGGTCFHNDIADNRWEPRIAHELQTKIVGLLVAMWFADRDDRVSFENVEDRRDWLDRNRRLPGHRDLRIGRLDRPTQRKDTCQGATSHD
ncbi:MAG: hypothetical protein EXQ55_07130 [Acidobacteria bacterium]|nr:hypothetical protein [Acidobacteriota bacterium]